MRLSRILFAAAALATCTSTSIFAEGATPLYQAPAFEDGSIYLGVFLAYGVNHWNNVNNVLYSVGYLGNSNPTQINNVQNKDGFAWNLYAGYSINQYIGLQFDYTQFRNTTVSGWNLNATQTFSGTYKEYALTWSVVTQVPVMDTGFNIYAQLGLNYLRANVNTVGAFNFKTTPASWGPAFGAGVNYNFGNDITVKTGWVRFSGNNEINSSNYIPSIDIFGMGLTYSFVI